MDRLIDFAERACRMGAWLSGILILGAALLIGVEVVVRKAFGLSLGGADELAGFSLAICTAWGMSFALLHRAHIRIDSLYALLPVRLCAILDILSLAAFAVFFSLVGWRAYGVLEQSYSVGAHSVSPLGTPLVVPQALWVVGFAVFLVVALLLFVRALFAFATGDAPGVQRLIGSRSAREEVEEEIAEVGKVRGMGEVRQ
ncbi:MAG: TRAP transporter small permease [Proteobacteria bacterium]|nr:TRAP transporter small permease [Pseudomonadota bacterium]